MSTLADWRTWALGLVIGLSSRALAEAWPGSAWLIGWLGGSVFIAALRGVEIWREGQ